MTRWIDFLREYAKEHKISYGCAMSKKEAQEEYKRHKGIVQKIKTGAEKKKDYAKRYLDSNIPP